MGCVNGKERGLSEEDLEYLIQYTAMDKETIQKKYEYFKQHHPEGKLSKVRADPKSRHQNRILDSVN